MAKVRNWQLGREMEYPYAGAYPNQQFAFVFNINRCIGCQTCTMACKSTWTCSRGQEQMWWNNVETKPYGGYPQNWDRKLLALLDAADPRGQRWGKEPSAGAPYGEFGGKTVFEAAPSLPGNKGVGEQVQQNVLGYLPKDSEWSAPNIHEDTGTGRDTAKPRDWGGSGVSLPVHKTWFFYLQRICNHCTYPACLAACPRKAIYKRPKDGVVLIDQKRCRGYRRCVEACPYKKAMYRPTTRTSEKCIACYPRLEGRDQEITPDGVPIETRCMSACVGKIRLQGLVKVDDKGDWVKDPQHPLYYLVKDQKVALPLYPQFGTQPNGYYIPPRWAPRSYLVQMFGPGVDAAIERYVCPDRKLLAVLQLFRASRACIFRFEIEEGEKFGERQVRLPSGKLKTQELFNDTILGFDSKDREAVRISIQEKLVEREAHHVNSL